MSMTVGAYEAKTRFSELLERAARGETITVNRHGLPVAQLGPITAPPVQDSRLAVAELRRLRSDLSLGGLKIADLRDEGRR